MEFTEQHLEVAYVAYVAGLDGNGVVLADHAYPAAHDLAEQHWLERRVEENGDTSWWWTPAAEAALDVSALMESVRGREN